jgi:hypothetical protein
MNRTRSFDFRAITISLAVLAAVLQFGCPVSSGNQEAPVETTHGEFAIVSLNSSAAGATKGLSINDAATSFTNPTTEAVRAIIAGPPDYLKFTLKKVEVSGTFDGSVGYQVGWEGEKESLVDGVTGNDTSDIELQVPVGTIDSIRLTISTYGKIKGSLHKTMLVGAQLGGATSSDPVYTNAAYPWGAPSYTDFQTQPADGEMDISFANSNSNGNETIIEKPAQGRFLCGHLISDCDDDLIVAKGPISSCVAADNGLLCFDYHYTGHLEKTTDVMHLRDFTVLNTIGQTTPILLWDGDKFHGEALATLCVVK